MEGRPGQGQAQEMRIGSGQTGISGIKKYLMDRHHRHPYGQDAVGMAFLPLEDEQDKEEKRYGDADEKKHKISRCIHPASRIATRFRPCKVRTNKGMPGMLLPTI